jgi:hypothetical protein
MSYKRDKEKKLSDSSNEEKSESPEPTVEKSHSEIIKEIIKKLIS